MSARTATRRATTRALFLELVLDLVIFTVCAVICLQVFTNAHLQSSQSAALSHLGIEAQEVAELFRRDGGDTTSLASLRDARQEGNTISWYYDREFLPVADDQAQFTLRCVIDDSRPVRQAQITLSEGSTRLLTYDVSSYQPGGGDGS
jgi:Tfp pilus assembly protein PilE